MGRGIGDLRLFYGVKKQEIALKSESIDWVIKIIY